MNDERILKRLDADYIYVSSLGYTVLGIFLQGSQNYGLSYEGSDIDTKAIVIPKFQDFVLNKNPVSTTLILPSNEHIDLKDIRLMHSCFRKQNINFLEILFTEYRRMNKEYEDLYQPMFENREMIAHYNNYAAVNCIAGMVYEKHKALEHPYPSLIEKIEKYGFDPKQLHHMIRCQIFLNQYIHGDPYEKCLKPNCADYLISVKANCPYTLEEAREIADRCDREVKSVKEEYMKNTPLSICHEADKVMDDVLTKVLAAAFRKEII